MNQTSGRVTGTRRLLVLVFSLVLGAGRTKPAFVVPLVDRIVTLWRPGARAPAPELADSFVVKRLGGPHEDVVPPGGSVEPERRGHFFEVTNNVIRLFFWSASGFFRRAFDVNSVFIGAG